MSSAERFWRDYERRKAEARAEREEHRRRINEMYRDLMRIEAAGNVLNAVIDGVVKPVVDAWTTENMKAASAPEKHSSHPAVGSTSRGTRLPT